MSKLQMHASSLAIGVLLGVLPDQLIPQMLLDQERWRSHLVNGLSELEQENSGMDTIARLVRARQDFVLAANVPGYLTVRTYDYLVDLAHDEGAEDADRERAGSVAALLAHDPAFSTRDGIENLADSGPVIEADSEYRPVEATAENSEAILDNTLGVKQIQPKEAEPLPSGVIPLSPIKPEQTAIGRIQPADQITLPETVIQVAGSIPNPDSGA